MRRTCAATAVLVDDLVDGASHVGLLFLDSTGLIVERSSYARELLHGDRGVREHRGRLTAERPEDAEALTALLDAASNGHGRESVTVGSPDGRRLVVHAKPVADGPATDGRGPDAPRIKSCIFLVDPVARISLDPETLARALGLTPVQSQIVASLVAGKTVREVAEEMKRVPGTIRWHIKQALARTGARRQPDLVRIALAATSLRLGEWVGDRGR